MKNLFSLIVLLVLFASSCKQKESPVTFTKYDETFEIAAQQNHEINRMKFKLIQSKYLDMNQVFNKIEFVDSFFK